jgi:hydrogenase small subunit
MFITRRQFLKYCAASAAALGLSQTDLLRIEKAMAAVTTCSPDPLNGGELGLFVPRVIWIAGSNCSGCATGLLNFVAPQTGFSPLGYALTPETWTETVPALQVAYPLVGALDGLDLSALGLPANYGANGMLDIGDVAMNVISVDYAYIVAAAAGDVQNEHLFSLVESGDPYVLMIEGAIPLKGEGKFCRIFEVPPGRSITIPSSCKYYTGTTLAPKPGYEVGKHIAAGEDVTMADGSAWLASRPNCVAVLAFGTCASWGGWPAAKGSKTGAVSVEDWLVKKNLLESAFIDGLAMPICNIPGCPPHPDWLVAPILELILAVTTLPTVADALVAFDSKLDKDLCTNKPQEDPSVETLDKENRHKLTYLPLFPRNKTFCDPATGQCPRFETGPLVQSILQAARTPAVPDGRCLRGVGCNGWKTSSIGAKADCPTRMFNTHTNWCVGNNYPCQGCTDPNWPDGCAPFFSATKGKWAGIK